MLSWICPVKADSIEILDGPWTVEVVLVSLPNQLGPVRTVSELTLLVACFLIRVKTGQRNQGICL